jgi:hypothetical protein
MAASLLTYRDKISNLYRGPSIDASYQVTVHLAKRLREEDFLEIDQSETRIACFGSFGQGVLEVKGFRN